MKNLRNGFTYAISYHKRKCSMQYAERFEMFVLDFVEDIQGSNVFDCLHGREMIRIDVIDYDEISNAITIKLTRSSNGGYATVNMFPKKRLDFNIGQSIKNICFFITKNKKQLLKTMQKQGVNYELY